MPLLPSRTLTTRAGRSLRFTSLGFGAAQIGNMGCVLDEVEAMRVIRTAWSLGLRYFDTAPLYGLGLSERRVGSALAGEERDSYVLSTKVGLLLDPALGNVTDGGASVQVPGPLAVYDYSYDGIMRSFEASLERLSLSRIDILLVHDIDAESQGSVELSNAHMRSLVDGGGWRALDELRRSGAVSAIGAGLNEWQMAERILHHLDPDIFLLAGRYTLLEQTALDSFLPACVSRGVGVVVGGPYNSGVLATGPSEKASYNYVAAPGWVLDRVRSLDELCRRSGATIAQAALQFPLGHPAVLSVIPGIVKIEEVWRNVSILTASIRSSLWAEFKARGLLRMDAPTPVELEDVPG